MSIKDFILSPIGLSFLLFIRAFVASLLMCGSIELFNFKKLSPFFTFKRVVSFFLLTFGLRLFINSILFFNIS